MTPRRPTRARPPRSRRWHRSATRSSPASRFRCSSASRSRRCLRRRLAAAAAAQDGVARLDDRLAEGLHAERDAGDDRDHGQHAHRPQPADVDQGRGPRGPGRTQPEQLARPRQAPQPWQRHRGTRGSTPPADAGSTLGHAQLQCQDQCPRQTQCLAAPRVSAPTVSSHGRGGRLPILARIRSSPSAPGSICADGLGQAPPQRLLHAAPLVWSCHHQPASSARHDVSWDSIVLSDAIARAV